MRELAGLGFNAIELTGNVKHCPNIGRLLLQYKDLNGLDFIIHNYLPIENEDIVLNLASTNPDTRLKSMDIVKHAIDISKLLGQTQYSVHPGFRHDLLPDIEKGFFRKAKGGDNCNTRENFFQTVRHISHKLAGNGFKIAIENLSPKGAGEIDSFLCTPQDIEDFFIHFEDMSGVGLLLDFGHLNVASQLLNFDKFKVLDTIFSLHLDKVFEIHLSDNDGSGDSHCVTELDSWQIQFLLENRDRLQDKTLVFEWQNSATKETFGIFETIQRKLTLI